jgi:predicted small lipoprotein YifL
MLLRPKFLLFAFVALTAAGCGLKGPLYRADEPQAEPVAPTSDSTGNSRKKEGAGSDASEQSEPAVAPPDPDRPAIPPGR